MELPIRQRTAVVLRYFEDLSEAQDRGAHAMPAVGGEVPGFPRDDEAPNTAGGGPTDERDRAPETGCSVPAADAPKGLTVPPRLLRRARRRVALVLASWAVIALVLVAGGIAGVRELRSLERAARPTHAHTSRSGAPARQHDPARAPSGWRGHRVRESRSQSRLRTWPPRSLETGEVRKIVETEGIIDCPDRADCRNFINGGRVVIRRPLGSPFDVSFGGETEPLPFGPCGSSAGVWVSNALGVPRQLTTPCEGATPADAAYRGAVGVVAEGCPARPTRRSTARRTSCSLSTLRMAVGQRLERPTAI